jgi:hypothetical protein
LGFKVIGKVTPETVKPLPATVAALTVTAEVPVEDRVRVCVEAVFTLTLPNDRLDELTLSDIAAASNCTPAVWETPAALADTVTACATLTAETDAEKLPLVAPAASVIEDGTVNARLLLAKLTLRPPLGTAAFITTVQVSVPAPVIVVVAQLNWVSFGTPLPNSPTFFEAPSAELLLTVSAPVVDPVKVGSNCKVSVAA